MKFRFQIVIMSIVVLIAFYTCTSGIDPEIANNPQVSSVMFYPPAGVYSNYPMVYLSNETSDVLIFYSTNGMTPLATADYIYTGDPIQLKEDRQIKAFAWKLGFLESETAVAEYTLITTVNSYFEMRDFLAGSWGMVKDVYTDQKYSNHIITINYSAAQATNHRWMFYAQEDSVIFLNLTNFLNMGVISGGFVGTRVYETTNMVKTSSIDLTAYTMVLNGTAGGGGVSTFNAIFDESINIKAGYTYIIQTEYTASSCVDYSLDLFVEVSNL